MTHAAAAPDGETRLALAAGIVCYLIWGGAPLLFMAMHRAGASPWEIVGQRIVWAPVWAGALVLATGRTRAVVQVFRTPRVLALLALSAVLIAGNWNVYVWAVNNGRNLEASLGYYIIPLLAMAAGALLFNERLTRLGLVAIALAAIGVVLQTTALGRLPLVSLVLAFSFGGYGVIRKMVAADAQTGLFVECALLAIPGALYLFWLSRQGHLAFGSNTGASLLLMTAGPVTVAPLALFAWVARRLPLSTVGFLQFIGPTIGFFIGVATGEMLTPMRILSFVFIWGGAAVYAFGAWRAGRRVERHSPPLSARTGEVARPNEAATEGANAAP
jgi:chloramphenicol-sensitive protein RarD